MGRLSRDGSDHADPEAVLETLAGPPPIEVLPQDPVGLIAQLRREAPLGLLLGIAMGGGAFVLLGAFGVSLELAGIVAASLMITSFEATVVASLLTLGLARLGADPALASGPIATVVQDLLSVAIYLGISSVFLAL